MFKTYSLSLLPIWFVFGNITLHFSFSCYKLIVISFFIIDYYQVVVGWTAEEVGSVGDPYTQNTLQTLNQQEIHMLKNILEIESVGGQKAFHYRCNRYVIYKVKDTQPIRSILLTQTLMLMDSQ